MKTKYSLLKIGIGILSLVLCLSFVSTKTGSVKFYKGLKKYCSTLSAEFNQIPEERKKELVEIGNYVIDERLGNKTCKLLFICTSNSRRSHMAQVWAQSATFYYGLDSIWTFSGGTEATKVHTNTVAALKRAGFSIETNQTGNNPTYFVTAGNSLGQWGIFSKKYNNAVNPKTGFCAAMVCSEADRSCPHVEGADLRVSLAYDDPKYYDNTPSQDQKYDERCRQIAREMFFLMDYVKQKLILKVESKKDNNTK